MKKCIYRTDYKLIANDNRDQFELEVNKALHNGWRLHKHLIMTNYPFYVREMTKEVMIQDSNGEPVMPEE